MKNKHLFLSQFVLRSLFVAGAMMCAEAQLPIFGQTPQSAQEQTTVNGAVYDGTGDPIIGASVIVEGTTRGTITDVDGKFSITTNNLQCLLGIGLANQIGVSAQTIGGVRLYAPKREGRVNMMRPDRSFNQASAFISGTFAVNQTEYDDKYMLISLSLARMLFDYNDNEATAVEISLKGGVSQKKAKREIAELLGERYCVKDRYEQQEDFFKIMQVEKALTVILLVFILLLASFNIVGSLSMLMIDKREDAVILHNLGADRQMLSRIFLYEGWMISLLGAAIGLLTGVMLSLGQQYFGWIKLGTGTEYIISAYPVQVQALDVLLVAVVVCLLGFLAAWIPSRKIKSIK